MCSYMVWKNGLKWLITAFSAPLILLVVVKSCSIAFGKSVWIIDCLTAVTAIIAAVVVFRLTVPDKSKTSA